MHGLRVSHIVLLLGVILLVAGIFVPWVTPVAWFAQMGLDGTGAIWFNWSPFDFLWNALMSAFPNAPVVNTYMADNSSLMLGISTLYLVSALVIAGFAYPLIRSDIRQLKNGLSAWPLLAVASWAGFMTIFGWIVIPAFSEFSDGIAVELRTDLGTNGGPIALAGAVLAFLALSAIGMSAHNRQLRASGRMLAAGEESADA
jgi:hypothetical protein